MLTRREALRGILGLAASPVIATPSLELIERLFWQRTLFPAPFVALSAEEWGRRVQRRMYRVFEDVLIMQDWKEWTCPSEPTL